MPELLQAEAEALQKQLKEERSKNEAQLKEERSKNEVLTKAQHSARCGLPQEQACECQNTSQILPAFGAGEGPAREGSQGEGRWLHAACLLVCKGWCSSQPTLSLADGLRRNGLKTLRSPQTTAVCCT